MAQLLLTHKEGISLLTLPKPFNQQSSHSTSIPLVLPSRFPSNITPQICTSSTGNVYVHGKSGVVWEYDHKCRRVSEINFGNGNGNGNTVERVLPLPNSKIACLLGDKIKVMQKTGVNWSCISTVVKSIGHVIAMTSNDGPLFAVMSDNQVEICDMNHGSSEIISLDQYLNESVPSKIQFSPSIPSTLIISIGSSLLRINLRSQRGEKVEIREIHPYQLSASSQSEITDMSFSPVILTPDGNKKGGLCALLNDQAKVALVGLDSESSAKIISFDIDEPRKLVGISFLDGATLAVRTLQGTLLIKDLRSLSTPPTEIGLPEGTTDLRFVPTIPRTARPSNATTSISRRTSLATVLGENTSMANTNTPPSRERQPIRTGKEKEGLRATSVVVTIDQRQESRNENESQKQQRNQGRIVSAPVNSSDQNTVQINPSNTRPPRASISIGRSTSASASSSQLPVQVRPRSSLSTHQTPHSHPHVNTPIIEEEEEEEETHSVDLTWALNPTNQNRDQNQPPRTLDERKDMTDAQRIEELRRQLGEMQMDMLRMGRGLKNEIRQAVQPLIKEIRENHEMMEKQRKEIERLRRGY